ncbi:MAG: hypothetical protein RLZZ299_1481 [Pseudomonadota bacterium]
MTPPEVGGYAFHDEALLTQALTHPSHPGGGPHYQRLEFLGDAIVGAIVSDALLRALPDVDEGTLHRARTRIVRTETFAGFAEALGLVARLRADVGVRHPSVPQRVRADLFEAVVGAAWLDGGWEAARAVVAPCIAPLVEAMAGSRAEPAARDPRSALQEWLQARGRPVPVYTVVGESGPDHARTFDVQVEVDGVTHGPCRASSKRAAASAAAAHALQALETAGR